MSLMFTDIVKVTPVTIDPNFGSEVRGSSYTTKAYVEDESFLRYNAMGEPIEPKTIILFPKVIDIKKNYYVQIQRLKGVMLVDGDDEYIERQVKMAAKVGGCKISHIEVML